ncbi:MAG TPA: hypothetical protein VGC70_12225, partial [Burkholderiales bacterium]
MSDLSDLLESPGAAIEMDEDFDAINALCLERGWGDGLPVIRPTAERVERMLARCDRPWNEPIARIAPRYGEATPLRLAANAVMAGCRPEYFPLCLLAIEAMCEEPFNLYGVQATTHLCAPLVIVNGAVAREIGLNSGHNAFGPGTPANATIGRAIRLTLLNIGGALPAEGPLWQCAARYADTRRAAAAGPDHRRDRRRWKTFRIHPDLRRDEAGDACAHAPRRLACAHRARLRAIVRSPQEGEVTEGNL